MWLTTVTCINVPLDKTMHRIELSKQNQEKHQQNDADHCFSFCNCNCCQSNFYITYSITVSPSVALTLNYCVHSSGLQNPALFDFWVPPKS